MDPRRAGDEDIAVRLAASLALDADPTNALAEVLDAADQRSLVGRIATVSIDHRTTLPVVHKLSAAGVDVDAVPLDPHTIGTGPLRKLAPRLASDPPRTVAALAAVLHEHQERLRSVVAAIGDAFPHEYMVGFGLAMDLGGDAVRESSDIDLFARSTAATHTLAEWLVRERGFSARPLPPRRPDTTELTGRKLWRDEGGHRVGIDLFGPGRPSGGHSWVPPYRDPDLLARARPVPPPGPAVLVAAPEDALAMLAEKTLRKGEFTHRRIHDALAILASPVDAALLAQIARTQHVVAPLAWLLERAAERGGHSAELLASLVVPRWERRMIDEMAGAAPRRATRFRAVHRRIWVCRYVRDAPRRVVALREVLQGRFRKPQGERSR